MLLGEGNSTFICFFRLQKPKFTNLWVASSWLYIKFICKYFVFCILSVVPTVPGRSYTGHFKVIPNKDVGIVQKAEQVNQRPRFKFTQRPFTTCLALNTFRM